MEKTRKLKKSLILILLGLAGLGQTHGFSLSESVPTCKFPINVAPLEDVALGEKQNDNRASTIYFDLAAGPITIKSNADHNKYIYTGYVYQNNGASVYKVTGTHSNTNSFYVYQSTEANRATTGYSGAGGTGEVRVPTYAPMMSPDGTKTWREFIIDNKDSKSVIDGWAGCAAAVGRTSTTNTIYFQAYNFGSADPKLVIDMTLDNVWCSSFADDNRYAINGYGSDPSNPKKVGFYSDGSGSANQKTTIKLKGDNHFHQVWFDNRDEGDYFHITSIEGDGSEVGSLTVTPINEQPFPEYWTWPSSGPNSSSCGCAIASPQSGISTRDQYGLAFNGGTVYAASPLYYIENASGWGYGCVGAGNNCNIHMEINGGILTAVCHGAGAAIGGGSGFGGRGGDGYITITGGETYAYQYGTTTSFVSTSGLDFNFPVPSTAIGGGSTFQYIANSGQVNITGGYVYAESVGGVAIGGGGSGGLRGGLGKVSIESGATVVARSVPGTIVEHFTGVVHQVEAGTSIGGGRGGNEQYKNDPNDEYVADGGDAEITITGGTLTSGSIGGGRGGVDVSGVERKVGTAQVYIEDGSIQGQFIMAAGAAVPPTYTMLGGHVNNVNLTPLQNFYKVKEDGGAVYMEDGSCSISGGIIEKASASHGGAVYMTSGEFSLSGTGIIQQCSASDKGGAVYLGGGTITVDGGTIGGTALASGNTATNHGGGIYMAGGSFAMNSGNIQYNTANQYGGGFAVVGGTVTITGGNIVHNQAEQFGGGFYVDPGTGFTTTINNTTSTPLIDHNTASAGGALYANSGNVSITSATISNNTSTDSNGGAFVVANGSLTVSHTSITGNHAPNGNGGGAYVGNGSITFNTGTTVTYNNAINGGGLYVGSGNITYNNGQISHNTATGNGGGIYANANVAFSGGSVSENTARNGGGLYANAGLVDFSSGTFSQNSATGNGGGIYVANGATVQLSGNAMITKNHVPETSGNAVGRGGGIYLGGQLKVGRNAGDPQGTHSLKVEDNYMGIEANNILNNIYLPTNDNVIELLSDVRNSSTKVGFSVNNGFRKVVYHNNDGATSTSSWLHGLLTEGGSQGLTGVIFDDSRKYMAVHVLIQDQTFDHNYIYLWGCWISAVDKDPQAHLDEYPLPAGVGQHYTIDLANDSTWHIYTKEGLAWLCSSVNGLNGCKYRPGTKAVMERDVDMSDFLWVPLGSAQSFDPTGHDPTSAIFTDGHEFSGNFDGKGHVISGLDCRYINSIHDYGLFGDVVGDAKISNVLVDDFRYNCNQETGTPTAYVMGGIAGRAGGNAVISNCEARGVMTSPVATTSIMGGIVGVLETGGTVHSCIGIPTIQEDGLYKGGIAGQTEAGTFVMNSFANASFPLPTGLTYVPGTLGGLVGENSGTVENCYARVQGGAPNDDTHFGWLVGANATSGQVNYCYSPANDRYYHEGENAGTLTGCGHYDNNAETPYLYARLDSQVAIANSDVNNGSIVNPHVPTAVNPNPLSDYCDKQLLLCLNHWVGTSTTYAKWQRPTTEAINGDYPVLLLPATDAVACTGNADGSEKDGFLHYGQVNDLLSDYTQATQAVWLYRKKDGLASNGASNAKLYIADKGSDGNPVTVIPNGTVDAYVGVMLDNSAGATGANPTFGDGTPDYTDWHMFSSPLTSAPLGIDYNGNTTEYPFSYGHPSGMPYWRFYPEGDTNHGYFPSYRYGETYSNDNTSATAGGNYYQEWDFYTYYEPEYHWINFKRNSNSHWHENATDAQITYPNETTLTQGKGYLLATREQTFLQCHGTLADGNVTIPVTCSGAYSPGYNFLGNPYLAYLDFDEFARFNSGADSLWSDYSLAGYGIIDEDEYTTDNGGYIYYATDASVNPMLAPRYIAPHQGFMVHLTAQPAHPATFTTGTVAGQPDMRSLVGDGGKFRGDERPAYPLVNMLAYDDNGNRSIATVELGRPDRGGLQLMRELKGAKCHVYCRYDGEDWTIAFTQPGLTEAAIRFEALEDGEFTMKWNTQNGDFHYLHLVDNQTGADVDCLATDEYRFTATAEDYRSRFRLVFGYTGIEEPEAGEAGDNTFAFQSGDELVVTGEGSLTMFDVTGRAVMSTETYGVQTAAPLPNVAAGVYLLQLRTANGTKVQKIVIK